MTKVNDIDYIVRKAEARQLLGGLSESHFDELVRQGLLPKPIKIIPGGRAAGYHISVLREYLNRRREESHNDRL